MIKLENFVWNNFFGSFGFGIFCVSKCVQMCLVTIPFVCCIFSTLRWRYSIPCSRACSLEIASTSKESIPCDSVWLWVKAIEAADSHSQVFRINRKPGVSLLYSMCIWLFLCCIWKCRTSTYPTENETQNADLFHCISVISDASFLVDSSNPK